MNEFTHYCSRYYKLTQLLNKRITRLADLLANVPLYRGETSLTDIDAIITYYRDIEERKKKADQTATDLKTTGKIILTIMEHFEIPPYTALTGQIPDEVEYEIYADETQTLHITKTKDLAPVAENGTIMLIKPSSGDDSGEEEE